jgi:hypothetical protein
MYSGKIAVPPGGGGIVINENGPVILPKLLPINSPFGTIVCVFLGKKTPKPEKK